MCERVWVNSYLHWPEASLHILRLSNLEGHCVSSKSPARECETGRRELLEWIKEIYILPNEGWVICPLSRQVDDYLHAMQTQSEIWIAVARPDVTRRLPVSSLSASWSGLCAQPPPFGTLRTSRKSRWTWCQESESKGWQSVPSPPERQHQLTARLSNNMLAFYFQKLPCRATWNLSFYLSKMEMDIDRSIKDSKALSHKF